MAQPHAATDRPRLLVATHNPGKLREFRALLDGCGFDVVGLADLGLAEEAPETGDTFAQNAEQKARFYHERTGLPTVADDSGLVVDALGGEPGVRSARYGPPDLDDRGRVALLLRKLEGVPDPARTARFVAALAYIDAAGRLTLVEGTVEGRIAHAPAGTGGFGYDPVFLLPERGLTLAQLPAEAKNTISHRARAAQRLRAYLQRAAAPSPPMLGEPAGTGCEARPRLRQA